MNEDEFIKEVRTRAKKIENSTIFFEMRRWGLKNVLQETVEFTKILIAISSMGIPITSNMVSAIMDTTYGNALSSLHRLGDKNIIFLANGKILTWTLNPEFKERLTGKIPF